MEGKGATYIEDEVGVELSLFLLTCHLRGWVELVEHLPKGRLNSVDGIITIKPGAGVARPSPEGYPPAWRLTEAGWAIINWAQPLCS